MAVTRAEHRVAMIGDTITVEDLRNFVTQLSNAPAAAEVKWNQDQIPDSNRKIVSVEWDPIRAKQSPNTGLTHRETACFR